MRGSTCVYLLAQNRPRPRASCARSASTPGLTADADEDDDTVRKCETDFDPVAGEASRIGAAIGEEPAPSAGAGARTHSLEVEEPGDASSVCSGTG